MGENNLKRPPWLFLDLDLIKSTNLSHNQMLFLSSNVYLRFAR